MLIGPMSVRSPLPGGGMWEKWTFRSRPRVGDVPRAMYCAKMSRGRTPSIDDRAEITDERRERVFRPERVRRGDRFAFLPEAAVQAADHFRLAIEQRQPLLDIAREPDEVVQLEELGARERHQAPGSALPAPGPVSLQARALEPGAWSLEP